MIRKVAVIIPTANAKDALTTRCVEIVRAHTDGFEIDLQVVESSGPDFRFSRSINRGIRASADADAWVLLNNDAWMDPGWLRAMVDTAQAHPEAGLVGAVLRFPDGPIQHAGGYIPLTPREMLVAGIRHHAPRWALQRVREKRWAEDPYMYGHWHTLSRRHRLDFLTAACVLITRPCLEKVGPYNEDYLFGSEDVDHSLRALENGFELALATGATGVHHEGASGKEMGERQKASDRTFRERWDAARVRRATRREGRRGLYH